VKDVCWDLPVTAPTSTAAEYELFLYDSNAGTGSGISDVITIASPTAISWTDQSHCGGFSYYLTYVSGQANSAKIDELDSNGVSITNAQIEAEINAIWANTDGTLTFNGYPNSDAWIDKSTGIGIWTV